MKYTFLGIFLFLTISVSLAQTTISGKIGYGFYSMGDLKKYQQVRLTSMTDVPVKIVDNFPPYINYKAFVSIPRHADRTKLRLYYGFQTTGSRISLTDYSGKLTFDMIVNGHMLGVEMEPVTTVLLNVINVRMLICVGTTTTFLKLKDQLSVGDQKVEDSYLFCSHGLDVEPGIRADYKYKRMSFGLSFGYLQDINLTFYKKGSPKTKLGYSSYDLVKPNWAGIRTGIEISVDLFNEDK